jgi:hypothetical protein
LNADMVLGVRFIDSIPSCVPAPRSTFFDSNGFSPEALRWVDQIAERP